MSKRGFGAIVVLLIVGGTLLRELPDIHAQPPAYRYAIVAGIIVLAVVAVLVGLFPYLTKEEKPTPPVQEAAAEAQGCVWHVPLLRNLNFTGRVELLEQLREQLTSGGHAALAHAIAGLGGVGKTQLALEYAYRHAADYEVVWWACAEEPARLASDYAALAEKVDVGLADTTDQAQTCEAVRGWLERNGGWLLVLDNAPGPDEVRDYLPLVPHMRDRDKPLVPHMRDRDRPLVPRLRDRDKPRSEAGHVIVTSRNPNWGGTARALKVVEFEESESVEFLLKRTGQQDAEAARALADELSDLPLALEQAGAYVEQTGISLAEYVELFRKRREELLKRGKPAEYPETVATTWEMAFGKVEEESPAAADLLRLCAFLAPDDVPLGLLSEHAGRLPEELAEVLADELARNDAVAALRRYSLATVAEAGLSLHRLVQAVVRDRLGERGARKWSEAAVRLVDAAFPSESGDVRTWTDCARLLSHALAAAGHAEHLGVALPSTATLLNEAGVYLRGRAEFAQAQRLHERALEIDLAAYGPDHPEVATDLNNLALVLQQQGDLAGARERFERALEIDTAAYGPDHPEVATDLNNLAGVLQQQGDLAGARERFERALEIWEAALGQQHPTLATCLNNLAGVLQAQGDLAGARERFERALEMDTAAYGPDNPEVATDLNNLAEVLRQQGNLAGARERFERALEITEKVLGPDHPTTATCLNNLAMVLRDQGNLAGARERFERALEITEKVLGSDHPTTATCLNNLALVLQDQGDLSGARERYERALEICRQKLGDEHPHTQLVRRNLEALN